MKSTSVVMLGVGLTGVSAGYHLLRGYRIYERSPVAGGLAVTVEDAGFRFDRTGRLLYLLDDNRIISTGRYGGWNDSSMVGVPIAGRDAESKATEFQR